MTAKKTMNLPVSAYNHDNPFNLLDPQICNWIYEMGWSELREIQVKSIEAILTTESDIIISANTSAGKTEAAFLPVLTQIAKISEPGFQVMYISPLKALINDQERRLDSLSRHMDIKVTPWHGDISQSIKNKSRKAPQGIILTTPESIEASLVRRPYEAKLFFQNIKFIIIDELHSFLQGPRGLHLSCLLERISQLSQSKTRKIGLSATLGNVGHAAEFLNPHNPENVTFIKSEGGHSEIKLQIRGYIKTENESHEEINEAEENPSYPFIDHLYKTMRGSNNLVFAGSRQAVETLSSELENLSEKNNVPNEFYPHHGSLSKELRQELEARLKKAEYPTTAIATTTLELGIDIGSVQSVAQIGPPSLISSLKQRLGRSGRRKGYPAILRVYITEQDYKSDISLIDRLRLNTIRSIASIKLLLSGFIEPPSYNPHLYSVIFQQILSIITQCGAIQPNEVYKIINGKRKNPLITKTEFVELLRNISSENNKVIEQSPDGALMLGPIGEKISFSKNFYTLFTTEEEWKVFSKNKFIGTIPLINIAAVGLVIILGGKKWIIDQVDQQYKTIIVKRNRSGQVPFFNNGESQPLDNQLIYEMKGIFTSSDIPSYLDGQAKQFLKEAREVYNDFSLSSESIIPIGNEIHIMTWKGTIINEMIALAFLSKGIKSYTFDAGITLSNMSTSDVLQEIQNIIDTPPSPESLADSISFDKGKYNSFISIDILKKHWVKNNNDIQNQIVQPLLSILKLK